MNIRKLLLSSVSAAGLLWAGSANAVNTSGSVREVYATATTTYIYVAPSSFGSVPTYVYTCGTTDPELARVIASSLHKNVYLSCNATTWPTTGVYRYGGAVTQIWVN